MTVSGEAQPLSSLHRALMRLQRERPFLHSVRYDDDRAEICYWEEGEEMVDAASLALRLWNEHRKSADLPPWKVVGLEVVAQDTYQSRHLMSPLTGADAVPRRF